MNYDYIILMVTSVSAGTDGYINSNADNCSDAWCTLWIWSFSVCKMNIMKKINIILSGANQTCSVTQEEEQKQSVTWEEYLHRLMSPDALRELRGILLWSLLKEVDSCWFCGASHRRLSPSVCLSVCLSLWSVLSLLNVSRWHCRPTTPTCYNCDTSV